MTANCISSYFGHMFVRWKGDIHQHPGAGRRVVDADVLSPQHFRKIRIVLSEVVKKPRKRGDLLQSEMLSETPGELLCRLKMVREKLPIALVPGFSGVCVPALYLHMRFFHMIIKLKYYLHCFVLCKYERTTFLCML